MGDFVFFDQLPPNTTIRSGGQALVHQRGHAGQERAVDDVAVAHHPADVAGGEIHLPRLAFKNMLHAGGQGHRIAAGVALHTLGLAGGARGVQGVADVAALYPHAGHLGVQLRLTQGSVVVVTSGHHGEGTQATVDHQYRGRFVLAKLNGLVQQRFVGHHFAPARTRIGTDDELGRGVFYARRQRMRRKPAKHHRMDGTNANTGQHGKRRLGDHGHVYQHAVTLAHAQALQNGCHALHLGMELGKAVADLGIGFCRNVDQRGFVAVLGQMTVNRVVAQICQTTGVPMGKGRFAVVTNLAGRHMPVDQLGLLAPKTFAVV